MPEILTMGLQTIQITNIKLNFVTLLVGMTGLSSCMCMFACVSVSKCIFLCFIDIKS